MSDTYDLLCKVAMGVPMAAEDLAALGEQQLIETKTLVTPKGRALMKTADAAKMTPVMVSEREINALLREYPALLNGYISVGRPELLKLSGYRAKYLIEIGTAATVYEWGDSPHERRPAPGHIARLSKWARNFLDARDGERGAAESRKLLCVPAAALPAPDAAA